MTELEFYILIGTGTVVTLVLGFFLRPKGKKKKHRKGKGKKDKLYKPDAYQDMGGDDGDFADSDLYAMKERKGGSSGFKGGGGNKKKKKDDEYESWEDY
ncbi:MAG: hypothetical protein ACTSV1_07105 [Alphaproteobacteria bacterium]